MRERNSSKLNPLGIILTVFVLPPAMLVLALINNAIRLDEMNRRKAPERSEKITEIRKRSNPKNLEPKTLEEVYAEQDAIAQRWEDCREALKEAYDYTDKSVYSANEQQVTAVCDERVLDNGF